MGKSIKRVDGDILMSDPTEEKVRPVKKEIESLPKDKETSDLTEEMINSVCIEEDSVFVHNISKGTLHVGFVDPKDKLKVLEIELNDYVSVSKKLFKTCEPLRKCLKKNLITIISKERAKKLDDRKALREKSKEDKDKSQESTTLPYKQVLNLIDQSNNIEELEELAENETRDIILKAIDDKIDQLEGFDSEE